MDTGLGGTVQCFDYIFVYQSVCLKLNKSIIALFLVIDFSWYFSEKSFFEADLVQQTDDYDQYQINYSGQEELLGQLFVYAEDIEILSPEHLKDAFFEKANNALVRNKKVA